ncbi:MAG: cysteine--tRNA ligase [Candidatus Mycalebacterium zealandia]|nr:MAG: cysteine--tRNA ligase [Candidatus Mycalebacterium zealandia]
MSKLPEIKLYNTVSRMKETFVPKNPGKVGIYVCGPTVYDSAHLGHARSAVSFDVIRRFLIHTGYEVTFVRNYTDVDDKIINRANETGKTCEEITETYIKDYSEDMEALGVRTPDVEPRVTTHMAQIVALVGKIIESGIGYESDGDVFFSVRKFNEYGKLSRRTLDSMLEAVRIDLNEKKEDALDFALWKAAKPGEPSWNSPWGKGRPGWHIECSAMSMEYLGMDFDIHGGGKDLIFPHHENEIAQSEAAGGGFAKYWMHNGLIQINREKMSKSLDNFLTVKQALERWSPEAIRLFFLLHHYRNPADFSEKALDEAEASLGRLYKTIGRAKAAGNDGDDDGKLAESVKKFKEKSFGAMLDDFNSAEATGHLFDLIREINRSLDSNPAGSGAIASALGAIEEFAGVVRILAGDPDEYKKGAMDAEISEDEITGLIAEREAARKEKDWSKADEIRNTLAEKGVVLEDGAEGTVWSLKRKQ